MHILIAPNAFKNSLDAAAAAGTIAAALQQSELDCTTECFPIGDGGDGTAGLLRRKWGAQSKIVSAHDPLGRPITASLGWIPEKKLAVAELADVSGLRLLKPSEYDPMHADTRGCGELIQAALELGAQHIILGIGGSATVDGASGMLTALGMRLMDRQQKTLGLLPIGLKDLVSIDVSGIDPRIKNTRIDIMCDVDNRLLGPQGAAAVFGPQKGASSADVAELESALQRWTAVMRSTVGIDMSAMVHGGAAGGVAAGLAAAIDARLLRGIDFFLEQTQFDSALEKADLLITGEGSIDDQTLQGKAPFGVAKRAKRMGITVIGLAGRVDAGAAGALSAWFDELISVNPPDTDLAEAMMHTRENLFAAAKAWGNRMNQLRKF